MHAFTHQVNAMTDAKNQENINQIPPMSQLTPVLKSPAVEGWKAGLSAGLIVTGLFTLVSVAFGKLSPSSRLLGSVEQAVGKQRLLTEISELGAPPKIWDIVKSSIVGNAVWGTLWGAVDGLSASRNAKRDNKEILLTHENAVLREQLGQAGEILNQTAAYMQMAGQPAASHAKKALADKAAHADAKSIA